VDYLARAIIGVVSLLNELVTLWANGHGNVSANVAAQAHTQIGDSISSIFTNGVNFIAALAAEILHQMGNTVS
jgi:hypothetical protein